MRIPRQIRACRQVCSMPVQIGHILYSGIMPWLVYDGTAGTMLAPVIFAMLVLLGAAFLLAIYLATQASVGPACSPLMSTFLTDVKFMPEGFILTV